MLFLGLLIVSIFQLQERHHNLLQYQIHSSSRVVLSDIFACLENCEEGMNIEDFSVSQTTLENVSHSYRELLPPK